MKLLILVFAATVFASCSSVAIKEIGQVNMISSRNVSLKENYSLIKSYAGSGKKDLKNNKAENIQFAIDNLVRSVPGGEFLQNVKIYTIDGKFFAVEGDVYGIAETSNFKGFKKGDRVSWKDGFIRYVGTITDLKNEKEATVRQDENKKVRTVKYEEMSKVE